MKRILAVFLSFFFLTTAYAAPQYQLEIIDFHPTDWHLDKPGKVANDGTVLYTLIESGSLFKSYLYRDGKKELIKAPIGYVGFVAGSISLDGKVIGGTAINSSGQMHATTHQRGYWMTPRTDINAVVKDVNAESSFVGQTGDEIGLTCIRGVWKEYPEVYEFVAVNKKGTAVGSTEEDGGMPVILRDGQLEVIEIDAIEAHATGINSKNHMVGYLLNNRYEERAFLYRNGEIIDLGVKGAHDSRAEDINGSGRVVGAASFEGELDCFAGCASLWEADERGQYVAYNLNEHLDLTAKQEGVVLEAAWSINSQNVIFVEGIKGEERFVGVLRPKQ